MERLGMRYARDITLAGVAPGRDGDAGKPFVLYTIWPP